MLFVLVVSTIASWLAALTSGLRILTALMAVLLTLIAASPARAQTQPVPWPAVAMTGNHPSQAATLSPLAHANPSSLLNLQISLGLRNRSALEHLLLEQQDPVSPNYHRWLTPAEFDARFGPSQVDLEAVAQW